MYCWLHSVNILNGHKNLISLVGEATAMYTYTNSTKKFFSTHGVSLLEKESIDWQSLYLEMYHRYCMFMLEFLEFMDNLMANYPIHYSVTLI